MSSHPQCEAKCWNENKTKGSIASVVKEIEATLIYFISISTEGWLKIDFFAVSRFEFMRKQSAKTWMKKSMKKLTPMVFWNVRPFIVLIFGSRLCKRTKKVGKKISWRQDVRATEVDLLRWNGKNIIRSTWFHLTFYSSLSCCFPLWTFLLLALRPETWDYKFSGGIGFHRIVSLDYRMAIKQRIYVINFWCFRKGQLLVIKLQSFRVCRNVFSLSARML